MRHAHRPDVACERIDPGWIGVPGEHEARAAADEGVEMPAALAKRLKPVLRCAKEYRVRLYRKHRLEIRQVGDLRRQPRGTRVRMLCIAQPRTAFEQADPGRRQKPHLGGELSGLFAAIIEVSGKLRIEEK